MTGPVLRAGAWPAVVGVSGVAVVVGGCGAAFPAAATALLPVCFALLAAAAAFTLDEPASAVVDVTPAGPARRTAIRAVALLAPLAAGVLVLLAAAGRGLTLPWAAAGLALAGNVLLGFAAACVARTRTGEPGPTAGTAVVLVVMAPALVPQVARWVRTFPAPGAGGPSPDTVWWTVLAVCVVAIAVSVSGRNLPRWMSTVPLSRRLPAVPGVRLAYRTQSYDQLLSGSGRLSRLHQQVLLADRGQGRQPDYPFSRRRVAGVGLPTSARPGPAELDQAFAEGQAGQVGAAAAAGLVPDPVQVGTHGADADVQVPGDVGVGAAPCDQGD
jgi:hypothetical protein